MRSACRCQLALTVIYIVVLTVALVYSKCPTFWEALDDKCYLYINRQVSWFSAYQTCRHRNGALASITSKQENDFVRNLLELNQVEWAWLGIHDIAKTGVWLLVSTSLPVVYTNWAPGEPYDNTGENYCGLLSRAGIWEAYTCRTLNFTFVCERQVTEQF
ncbi:low affinity immunoglobulin epsilon Fc receptor-like isoform X2 [Pomacea canaliculata]|uniref:low affinity immunoglobulin epsilon Fc receptor-like isoform X2 n=1 Tax=Pomacea canaliculata TaxID=400727 RepID=UPI000D72B80B|nr:low affinity immunoglobulin epsilon Fc receptor-like isoform X2 [Pomacea canaliculata]